MELLQNKNIAITSVSSDAYSETFIKAQVDLLPASLFLHTGWLPSMVGSKQVLSPWKKKVNTLFKRDFFSLHSELIKLLKDQNIGVVLAQYGPGGCAMLDVCERAQIDLVVHFHGYDATDKNIIASYQEQYQHLFKQAKAVIAVSHQMASQLIDLGCLKDKIVVNPCAPNDVFFDVSPDYTSNQFLAIGRFVEKKAPLLTLQAFNGLLKKNPQVKLVMAGTGPLLESCIAYCKEEKIDHAVSFPGVISQSEAMRLMTHSIAFIQHSVTAKSGDSEGTPVAILEASAAALPVVSTLHGGISDVIVNGETGVLVKEFDVDSMTEAMFSLLENRNLVKAMGIAGRKRVKEYYSMDKHIATLREVLSR